MRLSDWLESRTGYRKILDDILLEPVRGGARWAYVFGSVLTFLLLLQAATGVLLAAFYAPSSTTAWASVVFIQEKVTLGWFIRGLHSTGASAMIVVVGAHMAQVLLYGAYRAPRELNWLVGVLMLGLVLAFALTGYLLPWDQKGYWATQVATSIMGTTPVIGHELQELVQGGPAYGNYTLTHFFALHTYILPATIFVLLGAHLYLFRKHGVTPRWNVSEAELVKRTEAFWPYQLFRDLFACAVVFLIMVVLVVRSHGADLEAPADPASSYVARPEWYFLPLFQMLKYFEGPAEIVGTIIIPTLVGLTLLTLPFWDRARSRAPGRRLLPLAMAGTGFVVVVGLGLLAVRQDRADPTFQKQRAIAAAEAERARRLAIEGGVPPEGGLGLWKNDPLYAARALWDEKCAGCHSLSGAGGEKGPDLYDYNSRAWILVFLRDPDGPLRMGPAKLEKGMKPVQASEDELRALAEFVYSQSGTPDADRSLVARGQALFAEKNCDECHETDGQTPGQGPNLSGRGTLEYVKSVIADAGAPMRYGKRSKMPRFAGKLSDAELTALARLVRGGGRQSAASSTENADHSSPAK
ncbi:MAG TPA: cytochrome b N-terminal domain-containing protein [Polyangia bacterium]|nr:cytochrome b N-terminal domain-containing protein [Polyangia bacterium]